MVGVCHSSLALHPLSFSPALILPVLSLPPFSSIPLLPSSSFLPPPPFSSLPLPPSLPYPFPSPPLSIPPIIIPPLSLTPPSILPSPSPYNLPFILTGHDCIYQASHFSGKAVYLQTTQHTNNRSRSTRTGGHTDIRVRCGQMYKGVWSCVFYSYLENMRGLEDIQQSGGFLPTYGCRRALQEAFSCLLLFPESPSSN